MNATQALTHLRKAWGKDAGFKDHKCPTSPESRDAAHVARREAKARKDEAEAAMLARRDATLAADAEYQQLKAAYKKAQEALEAAPWPGYRYSGGTVGSMFFSVKAEADTLDELVEKARAKK